MANAPRSAFGVGAAAGFLGACIWLIWVGHSWEGVILGVVFMLAAMIRRK